MKKLSIKLNAKLISYLVMAACTLILILTVCVWASVGNADTTVNIVEGEVVFTEAIRREYLVGDELETAGVELRAGENTFSGEELTFTVDNSTAGYKMVEVSHSDDENYYRAFFPVTYFYVRHYDVYKRPTGFVYDNYGNITGLYGLRLWVELSGEPHELPRPLENHSFSTVVELAPEYYELTVSQDEYGGQIASVSFAGKKVDFYFVDVGGTLLALDSASRVLSLNNENENGDKLTLFVTQIENNKDDGENGATGWYVYEKVDGTKQIFQFAYYQSSDWDSHFHSSDYGDITEQFENPDYLVQIGDVTFRAAGDDWHRAILGY